MEEKKLLPRIKPDYEKQKLYLLRSIELAESQFDLADPLKQPPNKYFQQYRDAYDALDAAKADARKKVVKGRIREIENDLTMLRNDFWEDLVEEEEKWPRGWMVRDTGIAKMLKRTKFSAMLNYLWGIATKSMTSDLAQLLSLDKRRVQQEIKSGAKMGQLEDREFVLLTINNREAAAALRMSESLIQKYIQGFSEIGIIQDKGRPGPRQPKIYALGVWLPYGVNEKRRNPFLRDSPEWRKKLREFRLGSQK